jgi:hypothetical protein
MWTITMPRPKSAYLKLKFGIIMILEYGLSHNTSKNGRLYCHNSNKCNSVLFKRQIFVLITNEIYTVLPLRTIARIHLAPLFIKLKLHLLNFQKNL